MHLPLMLGRQRTTFFVEPDGGDAPQAVERGPREVEEHGLPGLQRLHGAEAVPLEHARAALQTEGLRLAIAHGLAVLDERDAELLLVEIHALDFPVVLLPCVEGEIVLQAEAAPELPFVRFATVRGFRQRRLFVWISQVKQSLQLGAERDVLQRGRRAVIPDRTVRQQARFQRQIEKIRLLAVIAIHANLEPALQMIDLNQLTRDRMRRSLGRELAIDELIPVRLVVGLAVLRIDSLLSRLHRTIGIGTKPRLALGVEDGERDDTTEEDEGPHRCLFLRSWFEVARTKLASVAERDFDLRQQGFEFRLGLRAEGFLFG